VTDGTERAALDPRRWQPVLDANADPFAPLDPGAAAALEWRARASTDAPVLASSVMGAAVKTWQGVGRADVDLVFVCLREALDRFAEVDVEARLSVLKDLLHGGKVLFFVMKTKCNLVNAGWEEFLDSLGLAFMGACR
jgi:hypothetical protein